MYAVRVEYVGKKIFADGKTYTIKEDMPQTTIKRLWLLGCCEYFYAVLPQVN